MTNLLTLIMLMFFLILPTQAGAFATGVSIETGVMEEINRARVEPQVEADRLQLGLVSWQSAQPLASSTQLSRIAARHALDIIERNRYTDGVENSATLLEQAGSEGYQAQKVAEKVGAIAIEYFIQPQDAAVEMTDSVLKQALSSAGKGVTPALLDPDMMEIGIAVKNGIVWFDGYQHNVYALVIVVARPIAAQERSLQCGHLYNDKNGNSAYDPGEGMAGREMVVLPLAGEVYPLKTGTDGAYCLRQPEDYWFIKICEAVDFQFDDQIDENPESDDVIDRDYEGWYLGCY